MPASFRLALRLDTVRRVGLGQVERIVDGRIDGRHFRRVTRDAWRRRRCLRVNLGRERAVVGVNGTGKPAFVDPAAMRPQSI